MSPSFIPEGERDRCEVRTADDQATDREVEFRELALLNQRLASAREPRAVPGVCTNCGERCLPLAVYCDPDCRDDHEHRLIRLAGRGAAAAE
jgi:uncharacterized OB-fold protein